MTKDRFEDELRKCAVFKWDRKIRDEVAQSCSKPKKRRGREIKNEEKKKKGRGKKVKGILSEGVKKKDIDKKVKRRGEE